MEEDYDNPHQRGAEPRVSGFLSKAVVQAVLLFSLENWVVTPHIGRALGGFRYQVAQRLTGRLLRRKPDGKQK